MLGATPGRLMKVLRIVGPDVAASRDCPDKLRRAPSMASHVRRFVARGA